MEAVIDYEYLTGAGGEEVPKEIALASENSIESFRFLPPYSLNPHASPTSGLTWDDGVIPYSLFVQTLQEATANIPHLHSKGDAKCRNLSTILGRSVKNLDSFGCPENLSLKWLKDVP
jgi:hypothetical protein